MIKYLLFFICCLTVSSATFAQKDSAVYYLKESGHLAPTKDSADYKLVILPPDGAVDKSLSIVKAYYLDGKLKYSTGSLTPDLPLTLQGKYTEFYKNGVKMRVRYFDNGSLTADKLEYYPNGNLEVEVHPTGHGMTERMEYYDDGKVKLEHHPTGFGDSNEIEYYPDGKIKRKQMLDSLGAGSITEYYQNGATKSTVVYGKRTAWTKEVYYYPNGNLYNKTSSVNIEGYGLDYKFEECRDSTGKILTQNGKGYWITYNDNFTVKTKQGKVVNGLQDSVWRISYSTGEGELDTYKKGRLIKTEPFSANGSTVVRADEQTPEFPGGIDGLYKFLASHLRYPDIARRNNTQGRVVIGFVVQEDGSLVDIKVVRGIGDGCDEEAIRVMKLSPLWKPGIQKGKPVKVTYNVPINFILSRE